MWFLTRSIARSMCTGAVNAHVETRSSWGRAQQLQLRAAFRPRRRLHRELLQQPLMFQLEAQNVGPIRTSSTTSGGGKSGSSCFSLSSCLQQQQQRPSSNLSVKRYFSSSHSSPSPGSGGGSLPAASSQFDQLPSLTSSPSTAAAASTFASKDYSKYTAFSHTRFL